MQTFSETDLRDAQALLPDSVQQLISVIGFPALTRLIRSFGGVTLSGKTGAHAERTGGVHALLHDVLTEDEINKLIRFLGGAPFYIPRCDHALRALRNTRFMADLQQHVKDGCSHRQALALLCPRYGISDRYACQLIHRRQKQTSLKSPTQVGLFD